MWDVTDTEVKTLCTLTISTHTSRVGCDKPRRNTCQDEENFYSHIPCGMWPICCALDFFPVIFLLTHPVWDVTVFCTTRKAVQKISTHTSRVGCDKQIKWPAQTHSNFYSHIPCGMWRFLPGCSRQGGISTHTSRVGCDVTSSELYAVVSISTHTSRVGCDGTPVFRSTLLMVFLLTHPVWDVT